jgi:cyclopropane fatty-acyl-phospholipid synthase-like methyltransferase
LDDWDRYNLEESVEEKKALTNVAAYMREAYFKKVEEILDVCFSPGDSVLDIGCGIGRWVRYLLERRVNCTGIDSSEVAVRKAKVFLREMAREDSVQIGDAARLDFKEESFDGIISFGLLEHFPNHEEVLKAWIALLKDGGKIIISVPNALRLDWLIWSALWINWIKRHRWVKMVLRPRGLITTFHGYEERWKPEYLKRLSRRVGLRPIETKTLVTLPAPLFFHISNRLPERIFRRIAWEHASQRWGVYMFLMARK